jgi:hypothetical protein
VAIVLGCESPSGPDNNPPVITGLHDTTIALGLTLVMPFRVWDPDGDSLRFKFSHLVSELDLAEGYHPKAGINLDDSFFWFTPAPRDSFSQNFYFTAKDPHGGETQAAFVVAIEQNESTPDVPLAHFSDSRRVSSGWMQH